MIYLITGVPGSGKTLYAVSTLVKKLSEEIVTLKDGTNQKRRLVVDGVPDLLLDHEMMAPGTVDGDGNCLPGEGDGLWNWHTWCKAGDVIFVDEVQRWWRPRGMGTKPPGEIKALETHRHKGVDIVIVTQNPMLLDQNVRRLVGRHMHVRRMFGMGRAVIYDWDGCSVDVHRTKTATVSYWGYPKKAFALYKSSELHTKQKQKIPPWLIVPVLGLVAAVFLGPKAFGVLSGSMTGKGVTTSVSSVVPAPVLAASAPTTKTVVTSSFVTSPLPGSSASSPAQQQPADQPPAVAFNEKPPAFSGCAATKKSCSCFDSTGTSFPKPAEFCAATVSAGADKTLPASALPDGPFVPRPLSTAELDVSNFVHKRGRIHRPPTATLYAVELDFSAPDGEAMQRSGNVQGVPAEPAKANIPAAIGAPPSPGTPSNLAAKRTG